MKVFFYGICSNDTPFFFDKVTPFILSLKFVSGGCTIINFCQVEKRYRAECFGDIMFLNICSRYDDYLLIELFMNHTMYLVDE
jgi:hypothetical protein